MKSKSYVFMFITSLFVFTSSLSAATIDSNCVFFFYLHILLIKIGGSKYEI